ncbi:MAG: ATP-binding protein [Kiritimatiellae bacterium]|nr:ATP-binding protein [Kiritimatiellia bacterium]
MGKKDIFKTLIAQKQSEMPFSVIDRDVSLPIDGKEIITIPGIRRCGKSTLMEIAINRLLANGVRKENILWIGFDDERIKYMTAEELDLVLQAYREMYPATELKDVWMFFDELPLVKDWEYFVLRLFKGSCKHIFICGSNASTLSVEMKSALRGWPREVEVWPLSFREYLRFKGVDADSHLEQDKARVQVAFNEYNRLGGMPEPTLMPVLSEKYRKLQDYFDVMLLRDLVEHWQISKPQTVRYFLKRVMTTIASRLSVNAIYREIKASGRKVTKDDLYDWLAWAQSIYLVRKLDVYSRSVKSEISIPGKYYVIDNGLRSAVIPLQSDDDGKQLENTVYLELIRRKGHNAELSYFSGSGECDFVVPEGDEVKRLIQVTWDMSDSETRTREFSGILEAAKATGCRDLTIVTRDEEGEEIRDGLNVKIVPVCRFLLDR